MMVDESHKLFANIGKISAAGHSFTDTIDRIMHEIKIYFRPVHCSLLRLDPNTNELFFASIMGMELEKVKNIRLRIDEGIAGKVAATRTSYFVPDTSTDPHFSNKVDAETGFVTRSIIAVPLVFQDTVQGVIEIVNRIDGTPYTEADHLILQTIADFAAIALYNASIFDQLFIKVHYDPLTALYNRTRLNIEYERHSQESRKGRRGYEERQATVVLLDLNDFKGINDSFGHLAGDNVLKDFAQRLKGIARDSDLIFRIGGDEFLLIAYNHSESDSHGFRERLTKKIMEIRAETLKWTVPYTFSFGMFSGHPANLENLIHQADMKMYGDKNGSDRYQPESK